MKKNKTVICPYCFHDLGAILCGVYKIRHVFECDCGYCGKTFKFLVECDPVYTIAKTDCLNGIASHSYEECTAVLEDKKYRCRICGDLTTTV